MNTKAARTMLALLASLALLTVSCAGSIREVQGAHFELNAQEDQLAGQWEQQEPRQAGVRARCAYWRDRRPQAMRDHAIGVLIWHRDRFVTLRDWANAKANQACGALAEQEAKERTEKEAAAKQAAAEAQRAAEEARKEKAARDAAEAAARKAAEAEAKRQRAHDFALRSLAEFEDEAPKFAKNQWTDDRIVLFHDHMQKMAQISESMKDEEIAATFTTGVRDRFLAVLTKYQRLEGPYKRALAAAQKRKEAERAKAMKRILPDAWVAMKTRLRAPSTAQLVSADVLLSCPRGAIILLTYDAQNGFGAMLRGRGIVKINTSGGYRAAAEGEDVGGFSPFTILQLAAQKHDCSQME